MIRSRHILFAFVLVLLCSCNRVIPKQKMVDIYVDMFLLDSWLNNNENWKPRADTTLFYDEIFHRHGVSFEEFNAAVDYYTGDIEAFVDIADEAAKVLEMLSEKKSKLYTINNDNHQTNIKNRVPYKRGEFPTDSLAKTKKLCYWPEGQTFQKEYYVLKKGENTPVKPAKKTDLQLNNL